MDCSTVCLKIKEKEFRTTVIKHINIDVGCAVAGGYVTPYKQKS